MRSLDRYQLIFCDIDDTLIYGFWTDLMKYTWNIFRNNTLSNILMWLQYNFCLFKVNQKLRYMLVNTSTPIVFLTARKYVKETELMLSYILGNDTIFEVKHLATDNPAEDKYNEIVKYIHDYLEMDVELESMCLFDDNKSVRDLVATLDIDTFDPQAMIEDVK